MPRDGPHRLAFFSLVPLNDRAWKVLNLPENAHLISRFQDNHDSKEILYGLDVGLHIGSKSRYTLATIGRSGDITVEGTGISRIHCSFEIPEGNKEEIMLQDRSSNKSTRFVGETAISFEENRPHRQVIVDKNVNLELEFGTSSDLHQFRLVWHNREGLVSDIEDREDNPRKTRTILDQPPTAEPSRPVTRIHTAPGNLGTIRYSKRDKLGSGSFGEVWKAANVDSGEYLAVKRVQLPSLMSYGYLLLKREVETLARISHKNIIEYIAGQRAEEYFDIIMELKPGSVQRLIRNDLYIREPTSANGLLRQMLQALDYLASKCIIHRDVKPENILYTPLPDGEYLYQLADFGLANVAADARTFAGSRIFMAPELDNGPQSPQTPEMDVWSLFVTLTFAMNVASFRGKPLQTTPLRIKAIQEAANEPAFRSLRDMAMVDPKQRATAGDMLDRLFGGEGRTTRRKQIRAAAMVIDDTQPGPSEPQIEAEEVVNTEERSREPAETAEEWPPRGAAVAGRRPRPASRATEKQRAGPAVETTALGPSDQKHARVTKQDAPRLHGATRARQRRYFT